LGYGALSPPYVSSAMGLVAPPIAFQAEWPPFRYFASKPASRNM